jgi:hypothetical protein
MELDKKQLEILQHALGVDEYGRGRMYRNHYVGGAQDLHPLVTLGLMREYPASELTGGSPLFRVTDAGKMAMVAASPKPPKLTRSQKRYRKVLAADCGYTFGEWLKQKDLHGTR